MNKKAPIINNLRKDIKRQLLNIYMKKSDLYDALESIIEFRKPKQDLEQYPTDSVSTADLLYGINAEMGDPLSEKYLLDLGSGTGRISLGSLLLGSPHVFSVEIDHDAIELLKKNAENLDLEDKISIIQLDISSGGAVEEIKNIIQQQLGLTSYDKTQIMCIMNPPFGFYNRGIDIKFLEVGIALASVVYSVHAAGEKNREYITKKVQKFGGKITHIMSQKLVLRGVFDHHKHRRLPTLTDIYRIELHP